MPIRPPALDDRSFGDLVDEMLARIPAHTPEWTNPRAGDPGRTMIELFAWLADTMLYRANLIPERQRLAFLNLIGARMRPAEPARGLVSVLFDDDKVSEALTIKAYATISGSVNFETRSEVTILPVVAEAYCKRPLSREENKNMKQEVLQGLQTIYGLNDASGSASRGRPRPYVTTPVFTGGAAEEHGFDIIEKTLDKRLWIALLLAQKKPTAAQRAGAAKALAMNPQGGRQLISIGFIPSVELPRLFEDVRPAAAIQHSWEISTGKFINNEPEYLALDVIADSTKGLTRRGVVRLALPASSFIGAPSNNVREDFRAGVGNRPPRIDDPEKAARLIAWLCLRPTEKLTSLGISWVGINAVEIDQRQTSVNRVIGASNGTANQEFQLPGLAVESETLAVQVEEAESGYQLWQQIDELAVAGRTDAFYSLDSEAGTIRFGDGVRGRIPEAGRRIRVQMMRAGGGSAGNLPAGSLTKITAKNLDEAIVTQKLKVQQSVATDGGSEAETLPEAETRIPALFRHQDRAVTREDYRQLAATTPGLMIGRVEVLPRFQPQQRRENVPGVVSVMALPYKDPALPPNPRADRPFIQKVFDHLDARRPLTTELHVIGCEYVPLSLSVAIRLRDGFAPNQVVNDVRDALRFFLWPLSPGGTDAKGWQLGKAVRRRELDVIVAQVPGVDEVGGLNLFERINQKWRIIGQSNTNAPVRLHLERWQLPELMTVMVVVGDTPPSDLTAAPDPFGHEDGSGSMTMAVPVVPEVC
ncbi:MAG TPA: putative baseplate assembly protein [Pyrinomonadaceae bacterium]|jgi:predicted phage baseplate assembly protein